MIFPKTDHTGVVADLSNTLLGWLVAKFGDPVDFSGFPEFADKLLVSSPDPAATRHFLDDYKLHRLVKLQLIGIHASRDIFTLSRPYQAAAPLTEEYLIERVDQAIEVYSIFLS